MRNTYNAEKEGITRHHEGRLLGRAIFNRGQGERDSQNKIKAFLDPLLVPLGPIPIPSGDELPLFYRVFLMHHIVQLAREWIARLRKVRQNFLDEPWQLQ